MKSSAASNAAPDAVPVGLSPAEVAVRTPEAAAAAASPDHDHTPEAAIDAESRRQDGLHQQLESSSLKLLETFNRQLEKREPLFKFLDYTGKLSIIVAAIAFLFQIPGQRQQVQSDAWAVITSAQGQGGSGGRVGALQALARGCARQSIVNGSEAAPRDGHVIQQISAGVKHLAFQARLATGLIMAEGIDSVFGNCVDLSGLTANGAYLVNLKLPRTTLKNANLQDANLQKADFANAELNQVNFQRAILRDANFLNADLSGTNLQGASLQGANLRGANLQGAMLVGSIWATYRGQPGVEQVCRADLRGVGQGLTEAEVADLAERLRLARRWQDARYDDDSLLRQELQIPPESEVRARLNLPATPDAAPQTILCEPIQPASSAPETIAPVR